MFHCSDKKNHHHSVCKSDFNTHTILLNWDYFEIETYHYICALAFGAQTYIIFAKWENIAVKWAQKKRRWEIHYSFWINTASFKANSVRFLGLEWVNVFHFGLGKWQLKIAPSYLFQLYPNWFNVFNGFKVSEAIEMGVWQVT